MAQFEVCRGSGRNPDIRFLLQDQNRRFDASLTRVVVPLVRIAGRAPPDSPATPYIWLAGERVYANLFDIATVPVRRLGESVTVLGDADQDRIICAIDEMISRA